MKKTITVVFFCVSIFCVRTLNAIENDAPNLNKTYSIENVKPELDGKAAKLNTFSANPRRKLEFKNGTFYSNGVPCFLLGSMIGSAQWNQKNLFLSRILGHNYCEANASPPRHRYCRMKDGKVKIEWSWAPYWKTLVNEMARNNKFILIDAGSSSARHHYIIPELLKKNKLAGVSEWTAVVNSFYGHYYPIEINSTIGQIYYFNALKAFLRYLTKKNMPLIGIELRNELGVNSFSPQALKGFRKYMQVKYKTIKKLNQVCRCSFKSFDLVLPPHLWDVKFAKNGSFLSYKNNSVNWMRGFKRKEKYSELYHDWIEFQRIFLARGFAKLVKKLHAVYGDEFKYTIQGRQHWMANDTYQTIDPVRLEPILDFFSHQVGGCSFATYKNRPATPEAVKTVMRKLTLYLDYVRGIWKKPIFDSECLIWGAKPPEKNIKFMLESAIVNLHSKWKYKIDTDKSGKKKGWFKTQFDDSSWEELKIPNYYYVNKARKHVGLCWYRKKFHLPQKYLHYKDYDFKKYLLTGKGLDDVADIYLNGKLIFSGGSWAGEYNVDITDALNYGSDNVLTVCINNTQQLGGIRYYMAIVDSDNASIREKISEEQTLAFFWQHAIHGSSGANYWQVYLPHLNEGIIRAKTSIASVAEIVMPRPRIKGKIAILYPFDTFGGLPFSRSIKLLHQDEFMDYYAGALFNNVGLDVLADSQILKDAHQKYQMLILPFSTTVRKGVFKKISSYVKNGGVVLITYDSLVRDDYFYEKLPLTRLIGKNAGQRNPLVPAAIGKGRVYYVAKAMESNGVRSIIKKILDKENIKGRLQISFADKKHVPYVEAQLIGNKSRFVAYFMNWGGLKKKLNVRINPEFLQNMKSEYRVRNILTAENVDAGILSVGELSREGVSLSLKSQSPVIYLFEKKELKPTVLKLPAPGRIALIRRLKQMRKRQAFDSTKPAVLFIEKKDGFKWESGKAGSPVIVDLLEKAGCNVYERYASELTEKELAKYDLVIIIENYLYHWQYIEKNFKTLSKVRRYLKNGGNVFVTCGPDTGSNAKSKAFITILKPYGFNVIRRHWDPNTKVCFANPDSCSYQDPMQVIFKDIRKHSITEGVKTLTSHCATPVIDSRKLLTPLVFSAANDSFYPSKPVLLAGNIGQGRVVVSGDSFFMQPFWIEKGNNLKLTWNILRWLLHDKIKNYSQKELEKEMLFKESDLKKWEKEEDI